MAKTATRNGKQATAVTPAAEAPPDIRELSIPRPEMRAATISIVGVSPLLMHKWSEKAIRQLEGSQTGKPKAHKAPKVPMEDAQAAAYIVAGMEDAPDLPGKFFLPAPAFKHAFLYGVSQLDDQKKFPKTKATGWMFMNGDPIIGFESVTMRSDITRKPVQMVYRLMFNGWTADLDITYNANSITIEQVVALFDLGGVGGVGEWRPTSPDNKTGDFGRFAVAGVTEQRAR